MQLLFNVRTCLSPPKKESFPFGCAHPPYSPRILGNQKVSFLFYRVLLWTFHMMELEYFFTSVVSKFLLVLVHILSSCHKLELSGKRGFNCGNASIILDECKSVEQCFN